MKQIFLIGGDGMLGLAIKKRFQEPDIAAHYTVVSPPHREFELNSTSLVQRYAGVKDVKYVINCAARHDAGKCNEDSMEPRLFDRGGEWNSDQAPYADEASNQDQARKRSAAYKLACHQNPKRDEATHHHQHRDLGHRCGDSILFAIDSGR